MLMGLSFGGPMGPMGPKILQIGVYGESSHLRCHSLGKHRNRWKSGRRPRSPCAAAPAADPPPNHPPSHSRSTEAYVIYGVLCLRCSKTSFFTVFGALRRQGISSWRCYKTSVFTLFWAPGGGPGRKNWHLKIVST